MKKERIMHYLAKKIIKIMTNSDIYIVIIPIFFYSGLLINACNSGLAQRPVRVSQKNISRNIDDNQIKISKKEKDSGFSNDIITNYDNLNLSKENIIGERLKNNDNLVISNNYKTSSNQFNIKNNDVKILNFENPRLNKTIEIKDIEIDSFINDDNHQI